MKLSLAIFVSALLVESARSSISPSNLIVDSEQRVSKLNSTEDTLIFAHVVRNQFNFLLQKSTKVNKTSIYSNRFSGMEMLFIHFQGCH